MGRITPVIEFRSIAYIDGFYFDSKPIIDFVKAYTLPTAEVNKSLAFYMDESGGDMEATAKNFLKGSSAWTKWVPADVAKKVKASL